MNRIALGFIASLALLATESKAWAVDEIRFGEKGQLIVSADRLFPLVSYTTQSITSSQPELTTSVTDSGWSMAFFVGHEPTLGAAHTIPRLAVDYTVSRRLTMGIAFALAFGIDGTHTEERTPVGEPQTVRENSSPGSTLLGFAPRAGYVLPINPQFAFWPRAGFGFYSMKSSREETSNLGVTSTATQTDTHFSLDLDPEFVWTPIPHVIAYAGPLLNLPLTGSHETTFEQATDSKDRSDDLSVFHLGISVGLGIWFDL
jgi:hypothetical protein